MSTNTRIRTLKRISAGVARRLPHNLKAAYYQVLGYLPKSETSFRVISGRPLRKLRQDVISTSVGANAMGTTNCGLVWESTGLIGIYKEGTFTACWELGIKLARSTGEGVRQKLWLAEFDRKCRLLRHRPISVEGGNASEAFTEKGILEDARLVRHAEDIVVVVNYVPFSQGHQSVPDQRNAYPLIGVLNKESSRITFSPLKLEGITRPQKNWIPFSLAGALYLQYSMDPHRVLRVDVASGNCKDAWVTPLKRRNLWKAGSLKGGAPPVNLGDSMLGACHSWQLNEDGEREYQTYFYTMEPYPPFQITDISPPLKLLVPDRIQYLIGMVLAEKRRSIILSYGVCDCDNYFVEVPLSRILSLLGC